MSAAAEFSTRIAVQPGPVIPAALGEQVAKATAAARAAQVKWSSKPISDRLKLVRQLRHLIAEQSLLLAQSSAGARGRPVGEALTSEVLPLAEACLLLERRAGDWLAPRRLGAGGQPLWLTGVRAEIRREPVGIVLIIGPGNYPLFLAGVQAIQALAAGNAVVLKPGVGGTAALSALRQLMLCARFDPDLVVLLPETVEAASAAIAAGPDKVLFTGSAVTGEKILAELGPRLIPATLELSGSDAVLLRSDADLDLAVQAVRFGLTLNGGATCLAPKRIFVPQALAVEFEGRLARAFTPNITRSSAASPAGLGDVLTTEISERLRGLIEEAISEGAHVLSGRWTDGGLLRGPLILSNVDPDSALLQADLFGPIALLVGVHDEEEAVARANDCPFALGASVFGQDESAARALAARLRAGVVTINDLIVPTADPRLPFGGRGRSGFGVTRGAEGLLDLTVLKVVTVSRSRFRPALERARAGDESLLSAYARVRHGRGATARCRALASFCRYLFRREFLQTS